MYFFGPRTCISARGPFLLEKTSRSHQTPQVATLVSVGSTSSAWPVTPQQTRTMILRGALWWPVVPCGGLWCPAST